MLKALSIREPWAWAIMEAGKDIENRNWSTKFRGIIAVHVAGGLTKQEHAFNATFIKTMMGINAPDYPMSDTRGFIVGTVEIIDCVKESDSPWFFGEYGFVLQNPVKLLTPIRCKGALGLWKVPDEIERIIREEHDARKERT